MKDLQWYDYLRLLIAVLSVVCLYNIVHRFHLIGHLYTKRLKEQTWGLSALLFLSLEGNLEIVIFNQGWGSRTILNLLAVAVCLRASFRNEGYMEYEDPKLQD